MLQTAYVTEEQSQQLNTLELYITVAAWIFYWPLIFFVEKNKLLNCQSRSSQHKCLREKRTADSSNALRPTHQTYYKTDVINIAQGQITSRNLHVK